MSVLVATVKAKGFFVFVKLFLIDFRLCTVFAYSEKITYITFSDERVFRGQNSLT